ncbi:unnamed protein product [Rotaria sordida]|uniref:P/Homo B domain-containing protein n=1 Tax=Rotaria sordida TaxID=392033 RepID=A0A813Y2S8_9BILA|nr:unnamed protein product [Rotaria sordida]CAF0849270.1 unnamed protein product [Rotaria sordida]CAF0874464.1 unnamed protein product [Rotaria sordida]CAF0893033.1 unnamed protein product [Rotaria sordida]
MLIVVTRHIIVTIDLILLIIVTFAKTENLTYTNEFVLHINEGEQAARSLAEKYHLKFERKAIPNQNYFVFRQIIRNQRRKRSLDGSDNDLVNELKHDPLIDWVEQQQVKKRVKRNIMFYHPIKSLSLPSRFNDPEWDKQWYMHDENEHGRAMNISGAWRLGFTGKNIVVTILDDGIEKDHPDLIQNYEPQASTDINGYDNDPQPRYDPTNENNYDINGNDSDPQPRMTATNDNKHGTRCAGEVAAAANNNICNVGVAFNARIGGIRLLDGEVTDLVESMALSFRPDFIDIYSASWGPDDDGKTVDGPATLAQAAFENGIKYGRQGLGSIYVWASGNGGKDDDNCNCDGYTNSIYTVSISSATENGNIPWYSESCSSTLATTYSSGASDEKQVVSTDLRSQCTENHTGTSASAPMAAGIIALALEANRNLTWRDIQHLIVETAKPKYLNALDWKTNGVGKRVSHAFGFGMMDAAQLVLKAQKWRTVPSQHICHQNDPNIIAKTFKKYERVVIQMYADGCINTENEINFLEHVQSKVSVKVKYRGNLQIFLTSPMGTNSTLLGRRVEDDSIDGFNNWPFMTVHNWGESPRGIWTLEIVDVENNVIFLNWSLVFYGTQINPSHQLPTTTSPKFVSTNIHLYPSDEINNNLVRSHSSNLHNSFHTRHREKNRKNKQQNNYYIKHHYYPYNPPSSSQTTSIIDDFYQIEMSKTYRMKPYLAFILILILILNHI